MKTTLPTRIAALLLLVLTVLQASAASAQRGDTEPPQDVLDSKASTEADAMAIAQANRWDLGPTVDFLEGSRRFALLAGELAEKYPDTFAAAVYGTEPGAVATLRFVGRPPADAEDAATRSGLEVKVEGDARYSMRALEDRAARTHEVLVKGGYEQVVTATNADGYVEATVFGPGRARIPRDLRADLELTTSLEPIATEEHSRGGAQLLVGSTFNCTSGFAVRSNGGVDGIATAAHCTGLNRYRQPSNGLTYPISFQQQHLGFFGDMEWHTSTHVEPAEYFATATQIREVNSVSGFLPVNTPTCVYGRASNNRACSRILSTFVSSTVNGQTANSLVATINDNTIPGDSGGPWSFSTEADGIHRGDVFIGGIRRNVYSRAGNLPIAVGVSVKTQ